ncbi:uncharacterized protein LOC123899199 [Trifolium pratense]|uniref:uncharacterized protein LOC123899199 n=1 Tax=Trifolium pratense TaxID=57577 RepID=UPI001E6979F0|nr:uncharacterized protein LOC123899199 [Trifolium pratense]
MSIAEMLQSKPITTCRVVRLSNLGYGEIDPNFIVEYYNKLDNMWFVFNSESGWTVLKYNKSYDNPIIFNGWKELLELHGLPNNIELELDYYGGNCFGIKSFKEPIVETDILPFHSRSIIPHETVFFDIPLTTESVKNKNLILPMDFASYLMDKKIKFITICGDYPHKEHMKVVHSTNPVITKLGNTWKELCQEIPFCAGDTIRFKFAINDPHDRCHMWKLPEITNA